MSMEMASSTISDLDPSFDDKIFFLALTVVLLDYSSIGTIFQILLRQVNFGFFLLVAVTRIILVIFVQAATSSTMGVNSIKLPLFCQNLPYHTTFRSGNTNLPLFYQVFANRENPLD
jgi:hypothetical protein